jgi:hypothetical protein
MTKTTIAISIDKELINIVKQDAQRNNRAVSNLIETILKEKYQTKSSLLKEMNKF